MRMRAPLVRRGSIPLHIVRWKGDSVCLSLRAQRSHAPPRQHLPCSSTSHSLSCLNQRSDDTSSRVGPLHSRERAVNCRSPTPRYLAVLLSSNATPRAQEVRTLLTPHPFIRHPHTHTNNPIPFHRPGHTRGYYWHWTTLKCVWQITPGLPTVQGSPREGTPDQLGRSMVD